MDALSVPGPTFEQPLEMLTACHDKVRRFARLAERLAGHVDQHGADDEARQAAASILRYFDLAAPLHHADEEADLFPALRGLGDPVLNEALAQLEAEHVTLGACWQAVRPWLITIEQGSPHAAPPVLTRFAEDYPAHADREERPNEHAPFDSSTRTHTTHRLAALCQRAAPRLLRAGHLGRAGAGPVVDLHAGDLPPYKRRLSAGDGARGSHAVGAIPAIHPGIPLHRRPSLACRPAIRCRWR